MEYIAVLELSEKYHKHFGPLRYFVVSFLIFLVLNPLTTHYQLPASSND
jgi:hypothetical protein